jgi:hypothetical protein
MHQSAGARWPSILLVLLATRAVASSPTADHYLAYVGTAVERHSLSFLYVERHVLRFRGNRLTERVVLYTCRDGAAFARKTVSYVEPLAPDFLLQDASSGLLEGVQSDGAVRSVTFRRDRGAPAKTAPLPRVPGLVADAGFDEFIGANWLPLVAAESLTMRFLLPSRLKDVDFEVYRLRSDSVAGLPAEVFRLKLAGALGWIVKPIDVTYGSANRELLRYDGVSDLRDASGNNLEALINFDAGDRTESDAQSMSAAERAPLAPCR